MMCIVHYLPADLWADYARWQVRVSFKWIEQHELHRHLIIALARAWWGAVTGNISYAISLWKWRRVR